MIEEIKTINTDLKIIFLNGLRIGIKVENLNFMGVYIILYLD
tara:strand:+ start:385 stop:510 length:126 start_codon:yes stop_codon:yes gene_type:complete